MGASDEGLTHEQLNLGEMVNWYTDPAVTRASYDYEGSNPSSPTKCARVV